MRKIYLFLVLLCFVGCSKEACLYSTPILKSEDDIIKLNMFKRDTSISFYANNLWEIKSDSSWLLLSKSSGGEGENIINIRVERNSTGVERKAEVILSSENVQRPFLIVQRGENDFVLSEDSITLNSKKQTFEIDVTTELFFDVECSESWLSYKLSKSKKTKKLEFSVEANITTKSSSIGEKREAKIVVKDRETSFYKEVKVVQMPYKSTLEIERVALEEFYNCTAGEKWKNNDNWLTDKPLSLWYGVKVSSEGKVVELNLKNNNLTGVLNSKLKDLVFLQKIDVSENNLYGSVPKSYLQFENWYSFDAKNKIIPQLKGDLLLDFYYPDGYVGNILKSNKSNPFEIVIIGDGFTKDSYKPYGDFDNEVEKICDYLFSISPFSEYKEYFNIDIVYAHSKEEGVDMKEGMDIVNTIFNTQFCITEKGNLLVPKDLSALDRYLLPINHNVNMCLMISNTDIFGWNVGEVMSISKDSRLLNFFVRDLAHKFGLVDEFVNKYKAFEDGLTPDMVEDMPNVDNTNDISKIKWKHFIGLEGYEKEGAFEGGYFMEKGVWRPQEKSIMGDLESKNFNAISRETIVKKLLEMNGEKYDFKSFLIKDKE